MRSNEELLRHARRKIRWLDRARQARTLMSGSYRMQDESQDRDVIWYALKKQLVEDGQWDIVIDRLAQAYCYPNGCDGFTANALHHFNDFHYISFAELAPHFRGIKVKFNELDLSIWR